MISEVLCLVARAAFYGLLVMLVLSWLQVPSSHPFGKLDSALRRIYNPALKPLGRIIPPLRTSAVTIDLSPIVLILLLQILTIAIC
jgi:uncharacterized protein YggT (Ycf19 family)